MLFLDWEYDFCDVFVTNVLFVYNVHMVQYFENDASQKDKPSTISFTIQDHAFMLESNSGVFSKDRLDTGTRILLEAILENESSCSHVLDLGCGIGPVGVVLGTFWHCDLTCIDVNEKAVQLTKRNLQKNGLSGNVLCSDGVQSGTYDCVVLNPPIRAGKKTIYRLFDEAMAHCTNHLWIVMRKQHGAASAQDYLATKYTVSRVKRDKGYWVLRVSSDDVV